MKRFALLISVLFLASCSFGNKASNSSTSNGSSHNSDDISYEDDSYSEEESSEDEPIVEPEIKDGPILHAWDWSITMVKNALDDIEKAGYKNVQLSPLHPSKDKSANAYWWNLYQPQGFKVATGDENPLGTKDQLKQLTAAAKEHNINIIMDVVTNHLGGPSDSALDSNVANFEPTIYNQNLIHLNGQVGNWNDRERVVTCAIGGYPDLQTDHVEVQKSVIRMLKEYIDCGVKGFRFDAAKHIETPDDNSNYSSDFWPNITDTIYDYGEQKLGVTPFVYGEILDNPCIDINAYTKYISVTDSRQGDDIRNGVVNRNASAAANSYNNVGGMEHAVLWAESHDTYENKEQKTTNISTDVLNLTYAIQISRKDATALFFARPNGGYAVDKAPQVISGATNDYKSAVVSAANKFHNDFVGGSENIFTSNSAVVNVRKTDRNEGALIADVNCASSSITVNVSGLSDGEYTNLVDNEKYTVEGGQVTVDLVKGLCVLEKEGGSTSNKASITITPEATVFKDTTYVNVTVKNATSSSYSINNGSATSFSKSTRVKVGQGLSNGEITFTVNASNDAGNTNKTIKIVKTSLADNNLVIYNIPDDLNLVLWVWNTSTDGEWLVLNYEDDVGASNITKGNYLIAKFEINELICWENCDGQTADFVHSGNAVIDYNGLTFIQ
ncbi:MAG: hypothetical protein K5906_04545 [Bacilli bacterium]|nr:hypothetical protein [Bacilli bacterium]